MTTIPKFVLPLVGSVAAIALAVGGAFLGANLNASKAENQHAVTVPVAGAVDADGASAPTGTRGVVSPLPKSVTTDPVFTETMRQLENGATPEQAIANIRAAASAPADPGGDPCSPASGTPSGDCPDGLHGAIFADTAAPDIILEGQALPPTLAQFTAHGNPVGIMYCPAATRTATSMPIGIASTLPAEITYEYWPTADHSSSRTGVFHISTTELTTYERDLRNNVAPGALPVSQHCTTLTGLTPNTAYTVLISGTDYLGRSAPIREFLFNSAGAPTRPTVQFTPVGPNLVTAVGFHQPDQSLEYAAYVVPSGATPSCPMARGGLTETGHAETTVDASYLNDHNYLPSYTDETVGGWIVPEGSNLLFCARWYHAGSAHSFERTQPIYQVQQLLQSPNRLVPTVTVLSSTPSHAAVRTVTVSTQSGVWCGEVDLGGTYDSGLPAIACRADRLASGAVGYVDGVGYTGSADTGLNLTVTGTEIGGNAQATNMISVSDPTGGCFGICTIPPDQQYPLDFHDNNGHVDGTAQIKVSWSQGNFDYAGAAWGTDAPEASAPGFVLPDLPQMDTDTGIQLQSTDLVNHVASAGFTLTVDRPVDYSATLIDATGAAPCLRPGGVATLTGHVTTSVPLSFSDLCLGQAYLVRVDLTDAAHHVAHWGLTDRATWWFNGQFSTPTYPGQIRYQWSAFGVERSGLPYVSIVVDGADLHAVNGRGGRCISDGIAFGTGTVPADLSQNSYVYVHMWLGHSNNWTPTSCPLDEDTTRPVDVTVPVPLGDLTRLEGARVEIPGASGMYVQLWVDPRP